jgi:hypothetical protein
MEKDPLYGLLNDIRDDPVAMAYRAWTLARFAVARLAGAVPGPGGDWPGWAAEEAERAVVRLARLASPAAYAELGAEGCVRRLFLREPEARLTCRAVGARMRHVPRGLVLETLCRAEAAGALKRRVRDNRMGRSCVTWRLAEPGRLFPASLERLRARLLALEGGFGLVVDGGEIVFMGQRSAVSDDQFRALSAAL